MKKLIILFIFIPFFTSANQNFTTAKRALIKLYGDHKDQKEFYCGCDFTFKGRQGEVNLDSCRYEPRKNQKRAERIEWEHVMPAENFGRNLACWKSGGRKACKKDPLFNKMEGDMHNLQPAVGEVNGDRSNYRYSQFTQTFGQYGHCKAAVDFKLRKFQPREEIRGIIARTYFYMHDHYQLSLSQQDMQLMSAWNKMYPPNSWECERNQLIKKIQGNDNHYVTEQCQTYVSHVLP